VDTFLDLFVKAGEIIESILKYGLIIFGFIVVIAFLEEPFLAVSSFIKKLIKKIKKKIKKIFNSNR